MLRLLVQVILLSGSVFVAAQSDIKFSTRMHDFGTIPHGTAVSMNFHFVYKGNNPLTINGMRQTIPDVSVKWDKSVYTKGQSGAVSVSFKPQQAGKFQHRIMLKTSGSSTSRTIMLIIKGTVSAPKKAAEPPAKAKSKNAATPTATMSVPPPRPKPVPVTQYGFRLSANFFDFGTVKKGARLTRTIQITNNTGQAHTIYFAPLFDYVEYRANPKTLANGKTGEISVTFDTSKCPLRGLYNASFFLITDVGSMANNSPNLSFFINIEDDTAPKVRTKK